jgi:hypothetical protein
MFSHIPMIVSRISEPVEEERKTFNKVRGWPGEIYREMMMKPNDKPCSLR